MAEEQEKQTVSPWTAYRKALDAHKKIDELASQINEIKQMLQMVVSRPPVITAEPPALKPGTFIHNVITEDDEKVVEEVVCPHCGTREVRTIPKKVVYKPIHEEGPPFRSVSELLEFIKTAKLPDGRPLAQSEKFLQGLQEILSQYAPQKEKKR